MFALFVQLTVTHGKRYKKVDSVKITGNEISGTYVGGDADPSPELAGGNHMRLSSGNSTRHLMALSKRISWRFVSSLRNTPHVVRAV